MTGYVLETILHLLLRWKLAPPLSFLFAFPSLSSPDVTRLQHLFLGLVSALTTQATPRR